jgi:hypothetical protein
MRAMKARPNGVSARSEDTTRKTAPFKEVVHILQLEAFSFGEEEVDQWDLGGNN